MFRSTILFFAITFILSVSHSFAQDGKLNFLPPYPATNSTAKLSFDRKPNFLFTPFLNRNLFSAPVFDAPDRTCTPVMESAVHYTAFFCKMENSLRGRFNVWIKIRAGGDEEYRKMITDPGKDN